MLIRDYFDRRVIRKIMNQNTDETVPEYKLDRYKHLVERARQTSVDLRPRGFDRQLYNFNYMISRSGRIHEKSK